MRYAGRLLTLIAVVAGLVCGTVTYGAEKDAPKKDAPKKEAPKKEEAKKDVAAERQLPAWREVEGKVSTDKTKTKTKSQLTVFDEFKTTAMSRDKKPFVLYFYWPINEKTDPAYKECGTFEAALAGATECAKVLKDFMCYRCDAKKLDKELKKKYAPKVPCMLIFEASGKQYKQITKIPTNEKTLATQLATAKKNSDKALEKEKGAKEGKGDAKKDSTTQPKK